MGYTHYGTGYTHYWVMDRHGQKGEALPATLSYQRALRDIQRLVLFVHRSEPSLLVSNVGAELPTIYQTVRLNGRGGYAAEDLLFTGRLSQMGEQGFCKTGRMPYDKVVVAALALLAFHMGKGVLVGSDGGPKDWEEGLQLARVATGRNVKLPPNVVGSSRAG